MTDAQKFRIIHATGHLASNQRIDAMVARGMDLTDACRVIASEQAEREQRAERAEAALGSRAVQAEEAAFSSAYPLLAEVINATSAAEAPAEA